jgi:hypothetical protein
VISLTNSEYAGLCEYYSGFDNIGHNTAKDLLLLWIIPKYASSSFPLYIPQPPRDQGHRNRRNEHATGWLTDMILYSGAWLVGPTIIIYELGSEIVNHLAGGPAVKRD